jgi:ABC-type glycerol-3-phosphate transport system substrate-binding protein
MTINPGRRKPAMLCAPLLAAALGLAACGGFDSSASGQALIKDYVKKFGQGKVTVKSVSCPSGVSEKVGGTYSCKVTLADAGTNTNGTVTIHMTAGNKVEMQRSDIHLQ